MKHKLYFGDPNKKGKFHIFEDGRSICGQWAMFRNFDDDELVKGTEKCGEDDCKKCFKKLEKFAKSSGGK